jgi:hypothetical protein
MWTWSLNWNEITPHIVIGTCPMRPDDLVRIRKEAEVSALLSLQHDDCLAYWGIDYSQMQGKAAEIGLALRRWPIRDFDINDMRRQLPSAVSTLAALQATGHRTYVHCTAGLGRSALVVLGYLTLDPIQCLPGRPIMDAGTTLWNPIARRLSGAPTSCTSRASMTACMWIGSKLNERFCATSC